MISARGVIQSLRTVQSWTNQNHGTVFSQQEDAPPASHTQAQR
jgi:hypothetical protein